MIAYFDTSALVPLMINEPASDTCRRLWNDATRTISTRLIYPEARAALAQAERMGRLTSADLAEAVEDLDSITRQIDYVEITAHLAESAGDSGPDARTPRVRRCPPRISRTRQR